MTAIIDVYFGIEFQSFHANVLLAVKWVKAAPGGLGLCVPGWSKALNERHLHFKSQDLKKRKTTEKAALLILSSQRVSQRPNWLPFD